MGKEQYMKLEQVDGDDEEAVVEAQPDIPILECQAATQDWV